MQRRRTKPTFGGPPPAPAAPTPSSSSSSSSSSAAVPSWVCLSLSYFVLLLHFYSSYSLLQRGVPHFRTLQLVLLAVNAVYVAAFSSLALQVDGLLSPRTGLLPLDRQLQQLQQLQQLPSFVPISLLLSAVSAVAWNMCRRTRLLQLSHLAWAGAGLAGFNCCVSFWEPSKLSRCVWQTSCCCMQFFLYMCFRLFGGEFTAFQWDVLLLECGFICCFAPIAIEARDPFAATALLLLLRLLLFKLLFSSAGSKLSAAAPHWRNLTSLHYHYWTQPLPSPGSWYAYWCRGKKFQAAAVLFTEGAVSFCIFGPPSLRFLALLSIGWLAVCLLLTGNVGFLPHLKFALVLCLLDDNLLAVTPPHVVPLSFFQKCACRVASVFLDVTVFVYFVVYSLACLHYFCKIWLRPGLAAPSWARAFSRELSLFCTCNAYGLFSVVTTGRLEVVLEELHVGPDEKPQWVEVFCPYKPGDIDCAPPWLWTGHFPRLAWRLWFLPLRLRMPMSSAIKPQQQQQQQSVHAAGGGGGGAFAAAGAETRSPPYPTFWPAFLEKLCARQPELLQLLGPQGKVLKTLPPPKSLRVSLYDYRMKPPEGLPLYAAFFPEGWTDLKTQDIYKLEEELRRWSVGRWWLRRHHQTLDVLTFLGRSPSAAQDFLGG